MSAMPSCWTCGSLAAFRMTVRPGASTAADFNQLELPAYQSMYWRGGPTPTADLNVTILAGATLGGGTVVNWTNSLKTKPHVREQWAREQQRGADLPRQRARHVHRLELAGDADSALVELLNLRTERADDLEHPADVADAWDVVKSHGVIGEQAGGNEWKCFVLIPGRRDLAMQRSSAFDNEPPHRARA